MYRCTCIIYIIPSSSLTHLPPPGPRINKNTNSPHSERGERKRRPEKESSLGNPALRNPPQIPFSTTDSSADSKAPPSASKKVDEEATREFSKQIYTEAKPNSPHCGSSKDPPSGAVVVIITVVIMVMVSTAPLPGLLLPLPTTPMDGFWAKKKTKTKTRTKKKKKTPLRTRKAHGSDL